MCVVGMNGVFNTETLFHTWEFRGPFIIGHGEKGMMKRKSKADDRRMRARLLGVGMVETSVGQSNK